MAYAIMRVGKLGTRAKVSAASRHNSRERNTPNADPERKEQNHEFYTNAKDKTYLQLLDEKTDGIQIRKNAVLGVEVFCSASPEAFQRPDFDMAKWCKDNREWLENEFGQGNVVSMKLHRDESTPHIHAFIVPMYEGKLNAKHYIGGTRDRLTQLQDSYAKAMKPHKLERGIEKSRAQHQDIRRFYGAIERAKDLSMELPEAKTLETGKGYRERVAEDYKTLRLAHYNALQSTKSDKEQIKVQSHDIRNSTELYRRAKAELETTQKQLRAAREFIDDVKTAAKNKGLGKEIQSEIDVIRRSKAQEKAHEVTKSITKGVSKGLER